MALDQYQPCPCGSGKKLKFCCRDVASEIEKIDRMLRGEQYAAALQQLQALTKSHPDRPSLECMKAMVEMHEEQFDAARQTLNQLIVKHPESCRAWAEMAYLESLTAGGRAAVEPLQKALETTQEEVPLRMYYALGSTGMALLEEGQVLAARAHLMLQAEMAPEGDEQPQNMLMRLSSSHEIPLLFKDDPYFPIVAEDAPWKSEYEGAAQAVFQGRWREALKTFQTLAQRLPDQPSMWRHVGLMKAFLADPAGAVEAWRRFTKANVPQEDAVEVEALAQLLEPLAETEMIDVVAVPRMILDKEAVETALISDDRIEHLPQGLARLPEEEGPPPLAHYLLLDKPKLKTAEGMTLQSLPQVLAQVYLYGRETDREARLVLIVRRDQLDQANEILSNICGAHLAELGEQKVVNQESPLAAIFTFKYRFPDDTTAEQARQLSEEKSRSALLQAWPALKHESLGGKTPREVAADPAYKIPVLAEILRLEQAAAGSKSKFDFNELRRELSLPERGPFDPTLPENAFLPLVRLGQVEVEKLTDEQLIGHYYRALMNRVDQGLKQLAEELLSRESSHALIDMPSLYGVLSSLQESEEQEFEYLAKAQQLSDSAGKSSARWDLAELRVRMRRGHVQRAQELLQHIRRHHMQEPGIGEALYSLLVETGVIDSSGRPAGPPPDGLEDFGASPVSPAPAAGGIWTPDSASGATGEKSKLWVPGMD